MVSRLVFDFYTNLNEFYGVITECCTQYSCPTMSGGPGCVCLPVVLFWTWPLRFPSLNYTWTDRAGKQIVLSAPTYIDSVMSSVQNLLDDENVFPSKSSTFRYPPLSMFLNINYFLDQDFHHSFPATVKHVYRQLLRVFAHIYHAHYPQILHLRSEPHFNSLFAHFLAFGREYELLEVRDIKGEPNVPVGVGLLWERWKEKGILEG
jgi:MOB kinase activator 1